MGDKVEPRKEFIERHAKDVSSSMSDRTEGTLMEGSTTH